MLKILFPTALLLAACSSLSGSVEVTDSWAPSMPPNAPAGVIYLTIENGTAETERLVDVEVDRCGTIELHATEFEDGIMRMRPAASALLEIASGETMEMVPGGLHVMCIDPSSPFAKGESLDVIVHLETAGTIETTAGVENR